MAGASSRGCSEPCSSGGARSCRLTRHPVALDVGLPVPAELIIALHSRGFVCASVPFETARCLRSRSTPEGKFGLGALHDLGDRAVKEPANERAAEKIYAFFLFGREVYLLERGRPRGAGSAQPSFGPASWQRLTFMVLGTGSFEGMISVARSPYRPSSHFACAGARHRMQLPAIARARRRRPRTPCRRRILPRGRRRCPAARLAHGNGREEDHTAASSSGLCGPTSSPTKADGDEFAQKPILVAVFLTHGRRS